MVSQGPQTSGGVAVRIGRSIAALQPHLVQTRLTCMQEEVRVQFHATSWLGIDADHPSFQQVRIELIIPGTIKTVCQVDAFAVAADLNHLWAAQEPSIVFGMSLLANNAA